MEINTHNAEILLSAANKSHYPQDELPEIALAGRSNVGKSSFINTMLNRKNLARTFALHEANCLARQDFAVYFVK